MKLSDYITSTDRKGKVRLDPRKTFEAGSFIVSTVWGSILVWRGTFTFELFATYLAVWTTARWLRDREQRLNSEGKGAK